MLGIARLPAASSSWPAPAAMISVLSTASPHRRGREDRGQNDKCGHEQRVEDRVLAFDLAVVVENLHQRSHAPEEREKTAEAAAEHAASGKLSREDEAEHGEGDEHQDDVDVENHEDVAEGAIDAGEVLGVVQLPRGEDVRRGDE